MKEDIKRVYKIYCNFTRHFNTFGELVEYIVKMDRGYLNCGAQFIKKYRVKK